MNCFALGTEKKRLLQLSACSLQSNKTSSILGTAVICKCRLDWLSVLMIVLLCVTIWELGLVAKIILFEGLWINHLFTSFALKEDGLKICPTISFSKDLWQYNILSGTNFVNVSCLVYIIVNWIYLGLRLLIRQNRKFEGVTLNSGKLYCTCLTIFCNFILKNTRKLREQSK